MDDIRGLLFDNPIDVASSSVTNQTQHGDKDYDQHVRELALDKRAQPKDRAKTEEELALEAKEALENAIGDASMGLRKANDAHVEALRTSMETSKLTQEKWHEKLVDAQVSLAGLYLAAPYRRIIESQDKCGRARS